MGLSRFAVTDHHRPHRLGRAERARHSMTSVPSSSTRSSPATPVVAWIQAAWSSLAAEKLPALVASLLPLTPASSSAPPTPRKASPPAPYNPPRSQPIAIPFASNQSSSSHNNPYYSIYACSPTPSRPTQLKPGREIRRHLAHCDALQEALGAIRAAHAEGNVLRLEKALKEIHVLDAVVGEAVSDGLGRLTFENGGQLAERLLRWAIGVVGDAAGELEVDIEVGWEKFVQGQVERSLRDLVRAIPYNGFDPSSTINSCLANLDFWSPEAGQACKRICDPGSGLSLMQRVREVERVRFQYRKIYHNIDPVAVPPRAFTHAELAQALLPNALPPLPLPLPSPTPVPVPAAAPAPTPNPVPVQPALIFGETSSSSWSSDDDAEPPTMAEWEADDRERGRLVSEEDARLAGVAAAKGPEQGGEVLVKPEQEEEVEIEAGNVSCVSSAISSGDSGYESGGAVESV